MVERKNLPVGDYALVSENGLRAVVERKTFENLISEFGHMPLYIRLSANWKPIAIQPWS
jgi:hypothetical protein